MDFEQALRAELITLTNLNNKVFPVFAPEQTPTPFVVYQKTDVELLKTMDGTSKTRIGHYDIDIVAGNYTALQDLILLVKNKLIGFQSRVIGASGPYIQSVIIDHVLELYEEAPKLVRANFSVRFYYEGA